MVSEIGNRVSGEKSMAFSRLKPWSRRAEHFGRHIESLGYKVAGMTICYRTSRPATVDCTLLHFRCVTSFMCRDEHS